MESNEVGTRSAPASPADAKASGVAVASPLGIATAAGEAAAAAGGNAFDAALTAAAVLTVAYPHNCTIGGDLLALVRDPDGQCTFINASGPAPAALSVESVREQHAVMPLTGPWSITVPGLVAGWASIHARGAALPWSRVLQPAIDAAHDGVAVSRGLAEALAEAAGYLCADDGWREVFAPDGAVLTAGQTLRQPALSRTLQMLAEIGAAELYGGEVGRQLCAGLQPQHVPLTIDDLAQFRVRQEPPLELQVAGWQVASAPPNSQGFALLRLLGALDRADGSGPLMERLSIAQTARVCMASTRERIDLLADPADMVVDVRGLLTDAALAELLATSLATPLSDSHPTPRPTGDTVAVTAVDATGRSVSLIQSLYHSFGSQILEPNTGIVMHNRGACFSLDPASPNMLAAGKLPAHTLTPVLAERDGYQAAVGTMGGEMQPQILAQVLSHLLSGVTPQFAVASPRWTVGAWDSGDAADLLTYEDDLDASVLDQVQGWPGPLKRLPPWSGETGHSQVTLRSPSGLSAGTDPRADPH